MQKRGELYRVMSKLCLILLIGIWSCAGNNESKQSKKLLSVELLTKLPKVNADSVYGFVKKQVEFGPRVPETEPHTKCGDFIVSYLKQNGLEVIEQTFEAKAWNGETLSGRNIIASINPAARKRILFSAHWDTRPYADQDSTEKEKPILGANDGASGVGVLLELARVLSVKSDFKTGLDLIFFDLEDYGMPSYAEKSETGDSGYCLGSQYWSKNMHIKDYHAFFGVLLDMVGGKNAQFLQEKYSLEYAPSIVKRVWTIGSELGYSKYFIFEEGEYIFDDHFYINRNTGFPTIDIIHQDSDMGHPFFAGWHTHEDDMDAIDKETLEAVSNMLIAVLYSED